ncbi:LysR family transcriptional regulator [Chelatococcus asaccharovorans]|uniref:LysR family transcriptional regulator n=1 Tax=Chelatococcus asaccharovorans TaxID=28210 RepID=UPI00224C716A|nr:LysR family transcriptional regulator [Chelatococcus asaccharovorans]CAH1664572.1 LysR family transcriptional regulator [Chelatococcus asaccharovorans]CAH1682320.1 LysR family transcriptional regulator [Chelatococcus asaccharovorans]
MDVELRDLKWAVVASEHRSLRQAAQALNIRQSTLSRRLRFIEDRLGAELFLRSNGGTHPTVAGLEFLDAARRILEDASTAFRKLKARSRGKTGQLTIGVYASLTTGNMYATLAEHHRRYPEVDVHIVDGGHDRLFGALMAKSIDIAIMTRSSPNWDDRCLLLWSERVVAAIPDGHLLCQRTAVEWPELAGERILLTSQGPGPELEHLLMAKSRSISYRHALYQEAGVDRLLSLVSAGHGISLVLEGATGLRYEGVTYREVHENGEPTRLPFFAYWQRECSNPAAPPFLEMLRERYPDLSADPAPG